MNNTGKGLSIAGLVLGIVSVVLAWTYIVNIVALICGIIGIACASKGREQTRAVGLSTGMGTAGLALSIVGTALAALCFFSCTLCLICAGGISEWVGLSNLPHYYG